MKLTRSVNYIAPFVIYLFFYAACVTTYSVWTNREARREFIEAVDHDLMIAAKSLKHMLAYDFHDRATGEHSITLEEELKNRKELSGFAEETEFKYLYTVVRKDGVFYFSAPTVTEEEAKERERWYFYPYEDAPPAFEKAYDEGIPVYVDYSDQWGTFRSVILPETSPGGRRYLACADLEISHLSDIIRKRTLFFVFSGLGFILLSIPFIFLYGRILRARNLVLQQAKESLEEQVAERTTELKTKNDELTESMQLLSLLFESVPLALLIIRIEDLAVISLNPEALELFGYSGAEAVSLSGHSFFQTEKELEDILLQFRKAPLVKGLEKRLVKKNGVQFNALLSIAGIDYKNEELLIVGITDITERILAEKQRLEKERLEAAIKTAGAVCHELNQPLQVITSAADGFLIGSAAHDEEAFQIVNDILEQVTRMGEITSRLREITRYETKKYIDDVTILDLDKASGK